MFHTSQKNAYISAVLKDIIFCRTVCALMLSFFLELPNRHFIYTITTLVILTYLLTYLLHGAESFLRS